MKLMRRGECEGWTRDNTDRMVSEDDLMIVGRTEETKVLRRLGYCNEVSGTRYPELDVDGKASVFVLQQQENGQGFLKIKEFSSIFYFLVLK